MRFEWHPAIGARSILKYGENLGKYKNDLSETSRETSVGPQWDIGRTSMSPNAEVLGRLAFALQELCRRLLGAPLKLVGSSVFAH